MTQEHYYDLRPPPELFVISTCIHDWSVNGLHVPLHAYLCPSVRVCECESCERVRMCCMCVCASLDQSMCVDALFCMPQSRRQLESERLTLVINI